MAILCNFCLTWCFFYLIGGHIQTTQEDREGQEACREHPKWRWDPEWRNKWLQGHYVVQLYGGSERVLCSCLWEILFFCFTGPVDVSMLQFTCKGRCFDEVLPRFLFWVREDALRHPSEKVPKVQCRIWCQRFPSHLHRMRLVIHGICICLVPLLNIVQRVEFVL